MSPLAVITPELIVPLVLITVESVINEAPPIVPAEMIGDVIQYGETTDSAKVVSGYKFS
jgi:hypothetical protein